MFTTGNFQSATAHSFTIDFLCRDYTDMIAENWLSDVIFTTVKFNADLKKVKTIGSGDFSPTSLSSVVNIDQINDLIVQTWKSRAADRKSTMVFCVDVAHVHGLTEAFRRHGIDAKYVTGADKLSSRDEKLDAFKEGKYPVLLNCGVFTEGTDVPNIDCVLLARPTKSRNLLIQMIGRGMRLHEGKKNCHVIDMVSALETGVVTVPTLFGLDPSEVVKEVSMTELKGMKGQKEVDMSRLQEQDAPSAARTSSSAVKVAFTDYDSVFDLMEDMDSEKHIRALSRLSWVPVDEDKYVLQAMDDGHVTIERNQQPTTSGVFQVRVARKLGYDSAWKGSWRPYQKARIVATSDTFEGAVHAADTFAQENFSAFQLSSFYDRWRKKPATPGQVQFLNRFRDPDDQLEPDDITKGKAGDMITKIKFGARGRLKRIKKTSNRLLKKESRQEEMKEREKVQVGPLND